MNGMTGQMWQLWWSGLWTGATLGLAIGWFAHKREQKRTQEIVRKHLAAKRASCAPSEMDA